MVVLSVSEAPVAHADDVCTDATDVLRAKLASGGNARNATKSTCYFLAGNGTTMSNYHAPAPRAVILPCDERRENRIGAVSGETHGPTHHMLEEGLCRVRLK